MATSWLDNFSHVAYPDFDKPLSLEQATAIHEHVALWETGELTTDYLLKVLRSLTNNADQYTKLLFNLQINYGES
jgi:hypothetical protein